MLSEKKAIEKISRKFNNVPYNPHIIYVPHTFTSYLGYKTGVVYGKLIQLLFKNPVETINREGWIPVNQSKLAISLCMSRTRIKAYMRTLVQRGIIQKEKTNKIAQYRPLMICANTFDLVVNPGTWRVRETITKNQYHMPFFIDIAKSVGWYAATIHAAVCLRYLQAGTEWFPYSMYELNANLCFNYVDVSRNLKNLIKLELVYVKKVRQINPIHKKPWGYFYMYSLPQETKKILEATYA